MINTNLDYKKILHLGTSSIVKYRVIITALLLVCIFGFAVYRINQLSDPKLDEEKLVNTLSEYKEVDINEEIVETVRKLIESDVKVDPQFNNRNNPFAE